MGLDESGSRAVFDRYTDLGGNFIDTADVYAGGRSEEMVGSFVAAQSSRDRLVIATKSGFATGRGYHAGGNGARHILESVEGSLRRLRTDFIDLYWMHVWDGVTPAEEIVGAMSDLVRAGKIRYYGLSDTPAWFSTRVATLAETHGLPTPIAMQEFYSLVSRGPEREHVPAARALGMGLVPWSPLGYGILTGKYTRDDTKSGGRLSGQNPFGDTLFTDENWRTVDALREVAGEVGRSMPQVALAWLLRRPGVGSILLGARKVEQLADNLAALDLDLPTETIERLDAATGFDLGLYGLSAPGSPMASHTMFAGARVEGWR